MNQCVNSTYWLSYFVLMSNTTLPHISNFLPEDLNGYFKRCEHEINTRGNGSCVVLPKIRTEAGKKSFAY